MFSQNKSRSAKALKTRGIRPSSFTLIEVLISLVLIALGLVFSTRIFVSAKYFMKEAENKSRAMEIASIKMNEYLVKSYEGLSSGSDNGTDVSGFFSWVAEVQDKIMNAKAGTDKVNNIPYKEIEVICSYNDTAVNGAIVGRKVRLVNIVVYPYLHLFTIVGPLAASPDKYAPFFTDTALDVYNYHKNDALIASLTFDTKVRANLMIFYNIAIDIGNSSGLISSTDLLFTKCFVDGQEAEIQTGTPILIQPGISNVVSVSKLPAGVGHTLEIIWFKDHPAGDTKLKKINVIIFQVEQ